MTQEEFLDIEWVAGTKVKCRRNYPGMGQEEMVVFAIDFDQCLIATISLDEDKALNEFGEDRYEPSPYWWRCENCELVEEDDNN